MIPRAQSLNATAASNPTKRPERRAVLERIEKEKLIAIIRGVEREKLIPLARALHDGGIGLAEITYSQDGRVSDVETAEMIRMLCDELGEKTYFGAGTVTSEEQVRLTKDAGGSFIISPHVSERVIRETLRCGLVSIPDALTPTEIMTARECRADFVKLFPVSSLGVEYLKALCAPLSDVKMLAVGGIDESNMMQYLKAGAVGVGVGSCLIDKRLIDKGDFDGIRRLARNMSEQIHR